MNNLRRNFVRGLSDIQVQFQEATSLNNYGPSIPQLECLALSSHDPGKFRDLVYVMDKRLNDHGKNWRHVFKTLVVLSIAWFADPSRWSTMRCEPCRPSAP